MMYSHFRVFKNGNTIKKREIRIYPKTIEVNKVCLVPFQSASKFVYD